MKLKLMIVALVSALAVPAAAFAQDGQDKPNPARACKALQTQLGAQVFAATYGTNADKSNAFGVCVSRMAKAERQNRAAASAACAAERTANAAAFLAKYGGGENAFGKCVSQAAKAASAAQRVQLVKAAQACKTERATLGRTAFVAKYGGKANAFAKCVHAAKG